MKTTLFIISLSIFFIFFSLATQAQKQKVIFDTDIGGDIDDAYALALLMTSPEIELLGVVTDHGNTPMSARIACRMLYETGQESIPVAVGRKTGDRMSDQHYWGEGFDKVVPIKQSGTDFIIEQLRKYPHEIILITVGPVTNMGDIIDKDPEALKLAKRIYSMFGSFYMGYGGGPIPSAESNVVKNVAASKKFVDSGAKITYAGLDITTYMNMKYELIEQLAFRNTPLTNSVVGLYSLWTVSMGLKYEPILYDVVAVAMIIWPELFKTRKAFVRVTDEGLTVIDESREPNGEIGLYVNKKEFFNKMMDRLMKQNLMRK